MKVTQYFLADKQVLISNVSFQTHSRLVKQIQCIYAYVCNLCLQDCSSFNLLSAYGREKFARKRRRGESQSRVSEWLDSCLSDGKGGREDRWTRKKNTVANQTENTFSLFLYLFHVNICSGNIRSFRFVSISSTGLSFLIFFNVYV